MLSCLLVYIRATLITLLALSMIVGAEHDSFFALNYTPADACDLPVRPSPRNTSLKQFGRDTFTQPLNHRTPELGTFKVNYYWNITLWAGPGSPVVVFLPGETKADRHLVHSRPDYSIVGVIAQNLRAAVLVLEHRYYGGSSPFSRLTTSNLTYLTVENSLLDIVNLANHFAPPWTDAPTSAKDVPWVLIGGSYSAAQTAWVANVFGGTFWSYLSLSPIIQSITSYWQYYLPQVEYGRRTCTTLLGDVVSYIDEIFRTGNDAQIEAIKKLFGLQTMDDESFLFQITAPVYYWSEQDVGTRSKHYDWLCDRIESVEGDSSLHLLPPGILAFSTLGDVERRGEWNSQYVQMLRALISYAEGFRHELAPMLCFGGFCVNESDPTNLAYSAIDANNDGNRQWAWLQCNDLVGGYIVGAPLNETSLVSRATTAEFFTSLCSLHFPPGPNGETFGANKGRTADTLNSFTGGWTPTNARRIIYSSGRLDVWREMGVSAERRPNGPLQSDPEKDIVVHLLEKGFHHSEMKTRTAELNEEVRRIRDLEVEQICHWVQQWPSYL
jgi:hypothetical protein